MICVAGKPKIDDRVLCGVPSALPGLRVGSILRSWDPCLS